jgi:hypothetical protein
MPPLTQIWTISSQDVPNTVVFPGGLGFGAKSVDEAH